MAQCPNCHEEVPADARFCPHCGAEQPGYASMEGQPPPPPPLFSPWAPPPMVVQTTAGGAIPRERARPQLIVGPPLSVRTVAAAVGAIMLVLLAFLFINHRSGKLPVLGMKGEAIDVGSTTWGVAFTDQVQRIDSRLPQLGQYFAVGVIIGNKGQANLELTAQSVGLIEVASGKRYQPVMAAWGTPNQITAGEYTTHYTLPPQKAIAGLIIFDVPKDLPKPFLLVRDLFTAQDFSGEIDLTQERPEGQSLTISWSRW